MKHKVKYVMKHKIKDVIAKQIKREFLLLIDGISLFDGTNMLPIIPNIDSYKIGVCKLEYENDVLHVYLRRPGLLIGKKAETIKQIKEYLGCDIFIHEFVLTRD